MSVPLVTVLIPTIGRMKFFPATMAAAEKQTYKALEIIILDNESPEDASATFQAWAARDSRVRVSRLSHRVGMFHNFARGIEEARGKYVTFFHDDDDYGPDFIECQVRHLEANGTAGFSGPNHDVIDEEGRFVETRRYIRETSCWSGRRYIEELIGRGRNPLTLPALVFRRDVFQEMPFPKELSPHFGDFVFLLRIAERWDVMAIADSLVRIRKHVAQESQNFSFPVSVGMRTAAFDEYCDEYAKRHPDEEKFVSQLRRTNHLNARLHLLWGWLRAGDEKTCEEARTGLGPAPLDRTVSQTLHMLERVGVQRNLRRFNLEAVARRVASVIRV